MFTCPACQHPGLKIAPYAIWPPPADVELVPPYEEQLGRASYDVCVLCGFEFGFDDNPGTGEPRTFQQYRDEWIRGGARWFNKEAHVLLNDRCRPTTIEEIVQGQWPRDLGEPLEADPLREEDALLEAQVLDIRFDALRSRVAILFELRLALHLHEVNTGLLVADEVTDFAWSAARRSTTRTAWNVVGSAPKVASGSFEIGLETLPLAHLYLRAGRARFCTGIVAGLAEIPDYGLASNLELQEMLPQWTSLLAPVHSVELDLNQRAIEG